VTLTPHPLLLPWSRRVELYLYSPYGPYGLYSASVPVQGCTLPKDNVMLGYILDIFPQVMEKKAIPVHPSCFTQLTTEHQILTFIN